MEFAFAIIVGLLGFGAGLGGSYALLEKRLNAQERSNQSRLNQEQAALEQVYQERLQATKEELKAQYETRLQQLEAQLMAPGMAQDSAAVAAAPVVEATPEAAAVAAVPVVGIAPEEAAVAAVVEATHEEAVVAAPAAAVSPGPVATVSLSPQAVASQVRSPEAGVRLALAQTLAAGLGGQSPAGVLQAIGALGQLSRDLDPQVRYAAIVGLGQVKSPKVLPFLRRGLRDSDGAVVKAASGAIDRFRSTAKAKPAKVKIAKKAAGKAKLA
ncbi:MAG: HEAT repeat domain-containing protein [Prochlorothrix sp.]|nr:HEAT repeat domain-containing protein [Prochlorothrix sp.]